MKISNRAKRNMSMTLFCLGVVLTLSRIWDVIMDPHSGTCWLKLIGIMIATYFCLDNYLIYRKRLKRVKEFGD